MAQRIGELIAGSPPFGGVRARARASRSRATSPQRVSDLQRACELATQLPPLEVVDRPAWIAANLRTMRPLLEPLTERMASDAAGRSPARCAPPRGRLLGAQVGALTGVLSQRVLGQYDLALLDADGAAAPAAAGAEPRAGRAQPGRRPRRARAVGDDPRDHPRRPVLGRAVAARAPRRDDQGADRRAAGDARSTSTAPRGGRQRWLATRWSAATSWAELRELVERARRGELLRLTLGEDRWRLVERMQAAMSLIEGHAEHTMDAVGAELLPSLPRLRAAMNRRRENRGLPWRVLERLLGLELKLRQYEVGQALLRRRRRRARARRRSRARGAGRRRCPARGARATRSCGSRGPAHATQSARPATSRPPTPTSRAAASIWAERMFLLLQAGPLAYAVFTGSLRLAEDRL